MQKNAKKCKLELRQALLLSRYSNYNNIIDAKINMHLISLIQKFNPSSITAYLPIKNEVNITPMINYCWQHNIVISLPCVQTKKQALIFKQYLPNTVLVDNQYNILQPINMPIIALNDIDLMFIPCVGILYTKSSFYRIGYGGGFYDITLKQAKGQNSKLKSIGIGHQDIISIKDEEYENYLELHDEKLDIAVTPDKVFY